MVEVTVTWIGYMVVDVDPEGSFGRSVKGIVSEARLGGAVESDGYLHIERFRWWSLDFIAARKEGQVVRGAVLIDVVDGFSHLLEGVTEGDLGANGIAIRAKVTKDNKGVVGADSIGYLLEAVIFTHTDGTFCVLRRDLDRISIIDRIFLSGFMCRDVRLKFPVAGFQFMIILTKWIFLGNIGRMEWRY